MKIKFFTIMLLSFFAVFFLQQKQKTKRSHKKTEKLIELRPKAHKKLSLAKKEAPPLVKKNKEPLLLPQKQLAEEEIRKSLSLVFQENLTWPLSSDKREELKKLNGYGDALSKILLKRLSAVEILNKDILFRMSSIDYLKYKMKWDIQVRELVAKHIRYEHINKLGKREKALFIAEYAELLGGLASTDWGLAANSIEEYPEGSLLKKISCDRAFHNLLANKGQSLARARRQVAEAGCPTTRPRENLKS